MPIAIGCVWVNLKEMLKELGGKNIFLSGELVDKKMWRFVEITTYIFGDFLKMFFKNLEGCSKRF